MDWISRLQLVAILVLLANLITDKIMGDTVDPMTGILFIVNVILFILGGIGE